MPQIRERRLSVRAFAELAGVSVWTVKDWVRKGYIKAHRNPPPVRRKTGQMPGWTRLYVMESELMKITRRKVHALEAEETPPLPIRHRKKDNQG